MLDRVKKVALVGCPMPSMCTTFFSKKLGGMSSEMGCAPAMSISVNNSGLACCMVATKLRERN